MVSLILFWMVAICCSLFRSPGVFPAIWIPPGAGRAIRYTPVADWGKTHFWWIGLHHRLIFPPFQLFWKCKPTAKPRSMFSPTLICMCRPNRAFMLRSFSLFISWVCSSYSMKGSRFEMAVAFTSPWAFFFRRHSLEDNNHWHLVWRILVDFGIKACLFYSTWWLFEQWCFQQISITFKNISKSIF